MKPDT